MKPSTSTLFLLKSLIIMSFIIVMPALALAHKSDLSPLSQLSVKVERIKQVTGQLHYQLFFCPVDKEINWQQLKLKQSGQLIIESN